MTGHHTKRRRGCRPSTAKFSLNIDPQQQLQAGRHCKPAYRPAQALRATGGASCLVMT